MAHELNVEFESNLNTCSSPTCAPAKALGACAGDTIPGLDEAGHDLNSQDASLEPLLLGLSNISAHTLLKLSRRFSKKLCRINVRRRFVIRVLMDTVMMIRTSIGWWCTYSVVCGDKLRRTF